MGWWRDPAAFHGRRFRPGRSSVRAGQAPQAHEHFDRTVAYRQRRQRARVRSTALGHSRTVRHSRGEDAILRRGPARDDRRAPQGFPTIENQGEYHIRSISAIKRAASGDAFVVTVAWNGLEEAEST